MPPVLHIAFDELTPRGAYQMLAGDIAFRDRHGHHVLQLIAETVGSAELIEPGPGPDAAGKRLVEQPAIQDQIHAGIGSGYLQGAENVIPLTGDFVERLLQIGGAIVVQQPDRPFATFRLTEQESELDGRARAKLDDGLQRGAGIEAGARLSGKRYTAFEPSRMLGRSVAADEFGAIACECRLASAEIGEADPAAKFS